MNVKDVLRHMKRALIGKEEVPKEDMSDFWLIVGLGNPGPEYRNARHNMGYMALDNLAQKIGISSFSSHKGIALVAKGSITKDDKTEKVFLIKPLTFMNRSGIAVSSLSRYYNIPPQHIIVLHDDMDLTFGRIKVKRGGSAGGHNGIRSIDAELGSPDYYRVRIGVGRPSRTVEQHQEDINWVLGHLPAEQQRKLPSIMDTADEAVEDILFRGLLYCQEKYNKRH